MTRRLLASYLSITAFVLLIIEVPLGVTFARAERDRLVAAVERDATVLATVVEDTLEAGATGGLDPVAAGYQDRTGGRVVIVDRQGVTVADSDPRPRAAGSVHPPRDRRRPARRAHAGSRSSSTLGSAFLYVAVPVASQGRIYGAVRITYPTSTVDARVRRVWLALAGVAAVVLGVVALVGFALARSTTRPLRALEQATTAVAHGDLEARAPPTGVREVRRLAEAFNDMAARLSRLLDSQRAFVADASHQLRTLTALRLRLENLEETTPAAAASDLRAAVAETGRLARLVDGLLLLARAEAAPGRREVVDLAAVVADRQVAWAPLAAEQKVELTIHPTSATPVWAVPAPWSRRWTTCWPTPCASLPSAAGSSWPSDRPAAGSSCTSPTRAQGCRPTSASGPSTGSGAAPPRQGGHWARAGHRPPAPRGQRRRRRAAPQPGRRAGRRRPPPTRRPWQPHPSPADPHDHLRTRRPVIALGTAPPRRPTGPAGCYSRVELCAGFAEPLSRSTAPTGRLAYRLRAPWPMTGQSGRRMLSPRTDRSDDWPR